MVHLHDAWPKPSVRAARCAKPGRAEATGRIYSARAPKGCTARVGEAMLRLRSCGVPACGWRVRKGVASTVGYEAVVVI